MKNGTSNRGKTDFKILNKETIFDKIGGKKIKTLLYSNQDNAITVNEILKHAAEVEPSNFHVWYAWGIINKFHDDLDEAEHKLQKALDIEPSSVLTQIEIARVLTLKKKYHVAERALLKILKKPEISDKQKITSLEYITDNYLSWANQEFSKKRFTNWHNLIKRAIDFVNKLIDFKPSDRKSNELYKKIHLNYGIRLYQKGRMDEGKECLLKVLKTDHIDGDNITEGKGRVASACYYLALNEMKRSKSDINEIDQFIKKGLKFASEENVLIPLKKLERRVSDIKNRRYGQITHFDLEKKYGFIRSDKLSCIFFPSCLSWFCKDFRLLVDNKVSFIPVRDSNGIRATRIKLIKKNSVKI